MQDDGISVNKNALENAKIHRLEKNMHGPEALRCSGPDEDSAQAAVGVCKRNKRTEQKRGAWDLIPGPPGCEHEGETTGLAYCS